MDQHELDRKFLRRLQQRNTSRAMIVRMRDTAVSSWKFVAAQRELDRREGTLKYFAKELGQ